MATGLVYVLSNPAMPGIVKIGFTLRDVVDRAQELSIATGVPVPFEIEYYCLSDNVEAVEREIHARLTSKRVSDAREFFRMSISEAVTIADSCIRPVKRIRFQRAGADDVRSSSDSSFTSTQNVAVTCLFCSMQFHVTLARYENGARCPQCHKLTSASIRW